MSTTDTDNFDSTSLKRSLASLRQQLSSRQELRRVLSNISWLFANNIIQIISGLLVGAWVARYLGPEDRGIMNYAVAYVALFVPLTELGLGTILIRELIRTPEERGVLMGTAFVLQFAAYLILLPVILISVNILRAGDSAAQQAVFIILLGSVFSSSIIFRLWFESQLKSKYFVLAQRGADLVGAIMRVILILVQASLIMFLVTIAFQAFLGFLNLVIFYIWSGERFRTWRFSLDWGKKLIQEGWPLALSLLAVTINLKIDTVMIGQMLDNYAVGVYGEAVRLSQLWYFMPLAIVASAYPVLVRAKKELSQNDYNRRYQIFFDSLAALGYFIALPVTLLSPLIVMMLYGSAYSETSAILSIHIWSILFVSLGLGLRRWLTIENLTIYTFWTAGSGAIINILLNFIMIPTYGVMGAAWTSVISSAVSGFLICLAFPALWPAGRKLALALLVPIRYPLQFIRS